MRRRVFLGALGAAALAWPHAAGAQDKGRVARIGWLTAQRESSLIPFLAALRGAFADIGYVEGRNLVIDYRFGDDDLGRVPALAAELVKRNADVILVQGSAVSEAAKLNLPVPLVYVFSGDPVTAGFADSLARPRGNMTGLTFMAAEFNGKRLELLRDIIPNLRRVAIVANPAHPGEHLERNYTQDYGQQLGLRTDYFATRSRDELDRAYTAMASDPPQAISLFADGFAIEYRQSIIDFGLKLRIPVVSGWPVFARSGALFTYGPHLESSYRRLAYYVDRILKGAHPSDLPIEQPTKFELAVNLKTAKVLGLTVPQALLATADDLIE
ncbi:ABC transporter substrate-binding protein [Rhodoplanes sp. Z2-YC6860]|uniref:ABC transporter substrate-binding protein n=1 Tax=Rhodoplanes sp. Z2-YC6860 TaxID=674703 RepID=UPI00078B82BC|nr:ABC transporter substrate-binding protein [Rhodoplanes sp. Z2-YC6860]AMN42156.1 ABC transporter substrate binding protein [Rhodoplanes sp. Z2-YC6860]